MRKITLKTLLCLAVLLTTVLADYNFPSAMPPAGKKPSEVKQIVTFIWDDNAYSGLSATQYEDKPGASFASSSFIDGVAPWGSTGKPNTLNLTEGMIGMSWAINTLAGIPTNPQDWDAKISYGPGSKVSYQGKIYATGTNWPLKGTPPSENVNAWGWIDNGPINTTRTRQNPDGSDIHFTFNLISGLLIPIWGAGWESYESKYGYFEPNEAFYKDGRILHTKISVSWGREMYAYVGANSAADTATVPAGNRQGGQINQVFAKTILIGHEVGNHTIDHMESNSPLPYAKGNAYKGNVKGVAYLDGFSRWGGEGFDDTKLDTLPWGGVGDEAKEFDQIDGNPWQFMGWKMYAGKYISAKAWEGAIKISEEELDAFLGLSVAKGNLHAFRAPRLEVNSGLHFALKNSGYLYDCGQEEGYEYYVDGTNFLWPYTTDNGSPNIAWQRSIGESMTIDSMPAGLWQIPVNAMIVPENIRADVYKNHAIIARAEAAKGIHPAPTVEDSIHWVNNSGKITGFDFNMFILWGMTQENALTTLTYNLDQRMKGNKAPMQVGCHTDYFTPIYDNATLQNSTNVGTYGLCVVNGWNNWEDRKATFERFIDYGLGLTEDVYFLSGKETIDYIKSLQQGGERVGEKQVSPQSWGYFKNSALMGSSYSGNISGTNVEGIQFTVAAAVGEEYPNDGLEWYESAGDFSGMTHLSLTYQTTAPLVVRLAMANGKSYEVTLSSLKNRVNSGLIPLSAFHENQYEQNMTKGLVTAHPTINSDSIIGVEIQLLTSGKAAENHTLSLSSVTAYVGTSQVVPVVAPAQGVMQKLGIRGFTNQGLSLEIPVSGVYTIELFTLDGRLVKSFSAVSLSQGVQKLHYKNLSSGMYMVRISNASLHLQKTMKAMLR